MENAPRAPFQKSRLYPNISPVDLLLLYNVLWNCSVMMIPVINLDSSLISPDLCFRIGGMKWCIQRFIHSVYKTGYGIWHYGTHAIFFLVSWGCQSKPSSSNALILSSVMVIPVPGFLRAYLMFPQNEPRFWSSFPVTRTCPCFSLNAFSSSTRTSNDLFLSLQTNPRLSYQVKPSSSNALILSSARTVRCFHKIHKDSYHASL